MLYLEHKIRIYFLQKPKGSDYFILVLNMDQNQHAGQYSTGPNFKKI